MGWWRSEAEEKRLRDAVLQQVGLPEAQLVLALSHTHAGPGFCAADTDKPGGELMPAYLQRLEQALGTAVKAAIANAKPAILESATGWCDLAPKP